MTNKEESWHVVGKSNKQKNQQQTLGKNQRKAWLENMPKLEENDPIKDTGTMFDAFIKKQEKQDDSNKLPTTPTRIPTPVISKKVVNGKKKILTTVPKKKPKMTFDEAVKKIQRKKLESVLEDCRLHFPNNPEVWMKDIASLLNISMDTVPDPDPVYKGRGAGFPHSELNSGCQAFLRGLMAGSTKDTLSHIFYYCIQIIMSEVNKGNPAHGYRMFLQSIALYCPDVIGGKKQQYVEMIKNNHQKASNCLTILWAIGQCGLYNIRSGLKLWLEVMLPFLTVKYTASYVVLYLEHVLRGDVTQAYGVMTIRDFFPLLDLIFTTNSTVQSDLRIRLTNLYPKLKQISIKDGPGMTLHLFFPSLLTRLTPSCVGAMRAELLSFLMTCLQSDAQSFSVWRQMYTKHLPQSAVLLGHIGQKWPKVKNRLGESVVVTTIQSFNVTNDELVARGNLEPHKSGSYRICKDLLKKREAPKMSWFWLLPLISTIVAAIIAYDVYTAKAFHESRTLRFMEEYGILGVAMQVYALSRYYALHAATWVRENAPVYSQLVYTTVVPYMNTAAHGANHTFWYIIETSRPHCVALVANAHKAYHAVYDWSPQLWSNVAEYVWWSIESMRHYLTLLWQYTIVWAHGLSLWLNDNVFTGEAGSVGEVLSHMRTTIHTHISHTYDWCTAVLTSWQ